MNLEIKNLLFISLYIHSRTKDQFLFFDSSIIQHVEKMVAKYFGKSVGEHDLHTLNRST